MSLSRWHLKPGDKFDVEVRYQSDGWERHCRLTSPLDALLIAFRHQSEDSSSMWRIAYIVFDGPVSYCTIAEFAERFGLMDRLREESHLQTIEEINDCPKEENPVTNRDYENVSIISISSTVSMVMTLAFLWLLGMAPWLNEDPTSKEVVVEKEEKVGHIPLDLESPQLTELEKRKLVTEVRGVRMLLLRMDRRLDRLWVKYETHILSDVDKALESAKPAIVLQQPRPLFNTVRISGDRHLDALELDVQMIKWVIEKMDHRTHKLDEYLIRQGIDIDKKAESEVSARPFPGGK